MRAHTQTKAARCPYERAQNAECRKIFRARNNERTPKKKYVKIDEQIIGFSGGISNGFTFAQDKLLGLTCGQRLPHQW